MAPKKRKLLQENNGEVEIIEKRQARYRSAPTNDIRQRISRAQSQRMYLVNQTDCSDSSGLSKNFTVLGSTGNIYDVVIARVPSCSCPDAENNHLCKHILFVFLKVLRTRPQSPLIFQKALLQSELREIFSKSETDKNVLARKEVIQAYERCKHGDNETDVVEEMKEVITTEVEGDCPICFENMSQGKEKVDQCLTCKNFLHSDCLKKWLTQSKTCVYCRGNWTSNLKSSKDSNQNAEFLSSEEGYLNLGALQGISEKRDTSSYKSRYDYGSSSYDY